IFGGGGWFGGGFGGWRNDGEERSQFGFNFFGFSRFSGSFGLGVPEVGEGAVKIPLGGVEAALDAAQLFGMVVEGGADGAVGGDFELAGPDAGLDHRVAAEEPFVADEGVDEAALFGCGGGG